MSKGLNGGDAPKTETNNYNLSGATFNGPTQVGNGNVQNNGIEPNKIWKLLKMIQKTLDYWRYILGSGLTFGGVWSVCSFAVDGLVPTLLWASTTTNVCVVLRFFERKRRERERAKIEAENAKRNFDDLSDEACELIVAALSKERTVHVRDDKFLLDFKKNNKPFGSDLLPAKRKPNDETLKELLSRNLLTQSQRGVYKTTSFAEETQEILKQRDNARIYNMLSDAAKAIFLHLDSKFGVIQCEMVPKDENSVNIFFPCRLGNDEIVFSGTREFSLQNVVDAVVFMQKNELVDGWYLKIDYDKQTIPILVKFEDYHRDRINIRSNLFFNEKYCRYVEGRLTKRGEEILRMFK